MNLTDAELAIFKSFVEERYRNTAHVTAVSADTTQYRSPRLLTPEIPPDLCVSMEKKNKGTAEKDQGRMNPEPTELELPSAGTGLETPGQQCPPNGRQDDPLPTAICLLAWARTWRGKHFLPTEIAVGTRPNSKSTTPPAAPNSIFLKASRKPEDKEKDNEENKQFDPGRKGEKPPPWNAAVIILLIFFFLGGNVGPWDARCLRAVVSICLSCFLLPGDYFPAS